MDPRAFLKLAHTLSQKSNDEAALRTSVSRSYYALHNFLVQFIENIGFPLPKRAEKHDIVCRCLLGCDVSGIAPIASQLNDLRGERNAADYNLKHANAHHYAKQAVFSRIKAQDAYNTFEKFVDDNGNRKLLIRGIAEYKRKCPF